MGAEDRSRGRLREVRSDDDGRTPAESLGFSPAGPVRLLLLDDANARAARAYNTALGNLRVLRNTDVARRYGLSSDTIVREMRTGDRVLNAARLLQGTRAELEAVFVQLRAEHIDVWGDDGSVGGGDPVRAVNAVVKVAGDFTSRAMQAVAHGAIQRDDAEALGELAETMRAVLARLDAALVPVLHGGRR
jgi:hypothetical protein